MEIVKLHVPDRVCIYELPPLSTSKGYYLDQWKKMIWEGGLKIFEGTDKLLVKFISPNGAVFAQLEVPEKYEEAIQKTEDSSRGYGVRLNNPKGGYIWIGLAFRDRNSSFDFKSRIIDFLDRKQEQKQNTVEFEQPQDFKLKQDLLDF
ncbi:hypothetical protein IMG5_064430 [Ichthyophthirius multifiliis]|uniref:NECAP PHear domain-containing protein n=1 Tax=Ichthyophthirius multifiliis TaxID=5932 RepID=G0QP58_ICHMU|nr:hypothetical protein IMG5_064430 [Ichthyophthirius multifiliis]EGR32988.1 hypothetical protein IMG5_064430 [Ichthyophthirius multifiliis]|eukprot:XP_004036974.1 hypothetical protein IMG5_064430 [Ichthyophthirius multifiliis]